MNQNENVEKNLANTSEFRFIFQQTSLILSLFHLQNTTRKMKSGKLFSNKVEGSGENFCDWHLGASPATFKIFARLEQNSRILSENFSPRNRIPPLPTPKIIHFFFKWKFYFLLRRGGASAEVNRKFMLGGRNVNWNSDNIVLFWMGVVGGEGGGGNRKWRLILKYLSVDMNGAFTNPDFNNFSQAVAQGLIPY